MVVKPGKGEAGAAQAGVRSQGGGRGWEQSGGICVWSGQFGGTDGILAEGAGRRCRSLLQSGG